MSKNIKSHKNLLINKEMTRRFKAFKRCFIRRVNRYIFWALDQNMRSI